MFAGWLRDNLTAAGLQELSGEEIVARLGAEQVEAFLEIYEQEQQEQRYCKFENLFPDRFKKVGDGEWSDYWPRSGYPRHMEFFKAGATFVERCFMAGNRCSGPWTFLETPSGEALTAEVWTSVNGDVLTWAGGSRCAARSSDGLLKSIEPAYRLVTASGRFADCSKQHRLLTVEGWLSLDRLVSLSDGLRSWHTRLGYEASCEADGYLGDRPLRSVAGIDLGSLPRQGGARTRNPLVFWQTDAVGHARQRILSDPAFCRLSNRDDLRRLADLFGHLSGPSSSSPVLSLSRNSQALQRSAAALFPPQTLLESHRGRYGRQAHESRLTSGHVDPSTYPEMDGLPRFDGRSLAYQPLGRSVSELDRDADRTAIFYPCRSPILIGGERIVAIVPIGLQPIIDAHVPVTNAYCAGGMVHHNTGKTVVGAYEMTCHLTGLYPEWWEGRRFRHPIRAIAAGDTNETTRDIIQQILLGEIAHQGVRKSVDGTGVIPTALIGRNPGQLAWKQGAQDLIDNVKIKHVTGGWSKLNLKSYAQGRKAFQGTAQHVIWVDEEPELSVYDEARIRTMTTGGITMMTYTPLEGLTDTVLSFLPEEMRPAKDEALETGDWGKWNTEPDEDDEG